MATGPKDVRGPLPHADGSAQFKRNRSHDVAERDGFVDSEATVDYYKVRAVDSAGLQGPASAVVCGTGLGTNGSNPGDTC